MKFRWLRPRQSLASRLAISITGAVTAALILAAILSVWRELDHYAADRRSVLAEMAQVFAYGGARATAENDVDAADATLRAIAPLRSLVYVAIERLDGSVLAEQGIGLRLTQDAARDDEEQSLLHVLATHTMQANAPILDNGRPVGRVVLIGEMDQIHDRIWTAAQNAALAAFLALAIGVGVSLYLQRSVTRPLAGLALTMDAVRLRHDYGQRAPVASDDEVGALARAFNDLLSAVNERDHRLAAHSAHLEHEVRARTVDLSEAKQAAEMANAAKSSFLATMSHEIRTPMNGVLVMAELLASSDLPVRQRRYADVIARSGKSLLAIINDILDFAKVEAGKLELERATVRPAEITDTVITLFAERAREAGLDLAAYVAPDVPQVIIGDSVRLGQVVSNFVSNALKFTQAGHVSLRMDIDAESGFLVIAVTDTGIGIPPEKLGTIFSAFSQADDSTTRRFGGTGLGLTIAQRIVAAMGGTVTVASRVGAGSTFTARIPVEVTEAARPTVRLPDVALICGVRTRYPATRDGLASSLRAAGFEPLEATDGTPAHWILDASELIAMGRRPDGADRVLILGAAGDDSVEQALRTGLADEVLRWPVTQADWQPVLSVLAEGRALAEANVRAIAADLLPHFPGTRVLVADDSAVNREVALEALARCGITDVVAVEDGAAAVKAAGMQRFDIILMDGSMPVMDGFDATRTIRQREAVSGDARTPIIALTAHVFAEAAEAAAAAGMDGTLLKPFTLRQLAALLQAHVVSHRDASPGPTDCSGWKQPQTVGAGRDDLLDLEVLSGLLALGDGEFVGRIVGLYRQQAPLALSSMRSAVAAADQLAIAKAAHSLKSMSANIGGQILVERLKSIESAARDAMYTGSQTECDAIGMLLDATIHALDRQTRNQSLAA